MIPPKTTAPTSTDAASGMRPERKKPYQKPEFVRERLFETMALACGKTSGGGACGGSNKRNS